MHAALTPAYTGKEFTDFESYNVTKLTAISEKIASMDELDGYNPADAAGFIRVNALRLKQHAERK